MLPLIECINAEESILSPLIKIKAPEHPLFNFVVAFFSPLNTSIPESFINLVVFETKQN